MNREDMEKYIEENYAGEKYHPWKSYPDFTAFRHGNRRCFAIVMTLPAEKLNLEHEGTIDVVNLKCSPLMLGSFLLKEGFFPAYHMNKEHWITIALDGSAADDEIKLLVDMSYSATMAKSKPWSAKQ